MNRKQKTALAGTAVVVLVGIGGGVAVAGSDDDATDRPIERGALQRASDAALAETGGGEVTGTEVGDEESYYEVEVTLPSGQQVDVQLDRDFAVVSTESEDGAEADAD